MIMSLPAVNLTGGPICLNPTTEREVFVWYGVLSIALTIIISVLLGVSALVIKLRKNFNTKRTRFVKNYGLALALHYACILLGIMAAPGGSNSDYCSTAIITPFGAVLQEIASLAWMTAVVYVFRCIFACNKE